MENHREYTGAILFSILSFTPDPLHPFDREKADKVSAYRMLQTLIHMIRTLFLAVPVPSGHCP